MASASTSFAVTREVLHLEWVGQHLSRRKRLDSLRTNDGPDSAAGEAIMSEMIWPHVKAPREVGVMVEDQAGLWALKQKGPRDVSPLAWPVVTIARETGDRDPSLGRSVARRLGFGYWDHGTVMELVSHLHADRGASFKFDERIRDVIEMLLGTEAPKGELVLADYADELRLVGNLVVRRGGVVVDGRGARLLVDPGNALRVRLASPFELRARRVEARDGISLEAAERLISSGDSARASFVLRALGHDVADPATFDIIVNTVTYPGERALALVLMAYFAKFGDGLLTAAASLAGGQSLGPAPVLPSIEPMGASTGGSL